MMMETPSPKRARRCLGDGLTEPKEAREPKKERVSSAAKVDEDTDEDQPQECWDIPETFEPLSSASGGLRPAPERSFDFDAAGRFELEELAVKTEVEVEVEVKAEVKAEVEVELEVKTEAKPEVEVEPSAEAEAKEEEEEAKSEVKEAKQEAKKEVQREEAGVRGGCEDFDEESLRAFKEAVEAQQKRRASVMAAPPRRTLASLMEHRRLREAAKRHSLAAAPSLAPGGFPHRGGETQAGWCYRRPVLSDIERAWLVVKDPSYVGRFGER